MSSGNEEKEEKKSPEIVQHILPADVYVSKLTPQQRGALITNSGKSPIAGLAEEDRKALVQAVLERAVEDERLADIAKDYGVSRTGLNKALLKYAEEDWKETQVARALTLVEDCEDDLESAADMVAISRARERLKSAHWKLERLHRRLFGQEAPNQSGSGTISINIGISRSVEPTDITPDNVVIEGK